MLDSTINKIKHQSHPAMNYYLFILLFIFSSFFANAQITFDLSGTTTKYVSSNLSTGTKVKLVSIDTDENNTTKASLIYNEDLLELVRVKDLENITFTVSNQKQFWQKQALIRGTYENLSKSGMQYQLRKELEEEALDYINYTRSNNLIFDDSYLESYLYALIYKIFPTQLNDGRPGILNLQILKSPVPEAFIFPNGSMFLSTGLLSTINSEEELIGIIAHEISHFVLDHSIININKAVQRKKRAEFWAAFATGVAAAADIYTAANNEYYVPGALTLGTAVIAYSVASELNERMGLKFSREQEMEADECAAELMRHIEIDPIALTSALSKIKEYSILNGNQLALTGTGTHPAIDTRIRNIGYPTKSFNNPDYDKKISFVNSFNAISHLNKQNFMASRELVNRNITADIATEDDYILLAMITTYLYDNEEKNNEALSYINKAKSLNVYSSININKQEAIILIRLGRFEEAKTVLRKYLKSLEDEQTQLDYIKNTREWTYANNFIFKEKAWTAKMINKVDKM